MLDTVTGGRGPAAHPVWLWLDPTTRCNLSCRLCYTKQSHGKLDLDPEDLRGVLDSLVRSPAVEVKTIHLNWRGEPLMNPRFAELLAAVRDVMPDIPLQWHTNGTMLTARRVREVLEVGWPHKIFVSVDGGNRHSHDLNRGEGSFARTLKGLKTLLDLGKGSGITTIGVYQIDLGEPLEDYDPEFLRLIERVDDHVKVKPLLPGGAEHRIERAEVLDSDETLARMMAEEVNPNLPVPHGPCFWAGHTLCMAPNGDTSICVISHGRMGLIGNLIEETPDVVVGRATAFRAQLAAKGRHAVAHCRTCRKPEGGIFSRHLKRETAA
jgi:MoaA/NifB/PqqE/SkfB family radical SAM enzyme